jgi:hypothetical protein
MSPETFLRSVNLTRYIAPLREGGSLPAIAEASDGFLYVVKFRGAGQGPKSLIAELIGGEVARAIGLKVPEIVFVTLDEAFGRTEPDEEIQDLLKASIGLNLGLHYLSGAITYDSVVARPDALLASKIVWLDSLLMNVDRTARNTNMLLWNKTIWLIDHGASLYFHHAWSKGEVNGAKPFSHIKDHVLLSLATKLEEADRLSKAFLTNKKIHEIVSQVPDEWIMDTPEFSKQAQRDAYAKFFISRIAQSDLFVNEANGAR